MFSNEMIIKMVVGGMVGLLFGSFAAFLNYRISKHHIKSRKNESGKNGVVSAMSVNFIRMLINAVALAAVFFLRGRLPWPFSAVIIGTALGLSVVSMLFVLRLSKCIEQS